MENTDFDIAIDGLGKLNQASLRSCFLNPSKKELFWKSLIQQFTCMVDLTLLWPRDEKHSFHKLAGSWRIYGSTHIFYLLPSVVWKYWNHSMKCIVSIASFIFFFVNLVLFIYIFFAWSIVAKLTRGKVSLLLGQNKWQWLTSSIVITTFNPRNQMGSQVGTGAPRRHENTSAGEPYLAHSGGHNIPSSYQFSE